MSAPTYAFYTGTHGGTLAEAAFAASLHAAQLAVDHIIWPNADDGSDEYMCAVCAAVDVDASYGGGGGAAGGISSYTIGSTSATYGGSRREAYDADMLAAVRRELVGTGLLYMGIG